MTTTATQPNPPAATILSPDPDFIARVPIQFARRHAVLGMRRADAPWSVILADDMSKRRLIENFALVLGRETRLELRTTEYVQAEITAAYQARGPELEGAIADLPVPEADELQLLGGNLDLLETAGSPPVIRLVNLLLFDAVRRRASDIHVQPREEKVVIRLRVDGVLFDHHACPASLGAELSTRIKVMGGMDVSERRLPQDGRATVRLGERLIDLRIATLPTAHGERVVIRLLDKGARLYTLEELGIAPDMCEQFAELLQRSHGIVLLTGPTGAGKSTTLYAALQRVRHAELNVVTLEDPIEYHLPGVSQTQINERKGMTFANGLRSVLRQDPDVIMVGEIRDAETARLAIQASLTGHLVLSTLHTNDSAAAIARLLDLGIEPYLVADSLVGVGAQRLVRINCPHCSAPAQFVSTELQALRIESSDGLMSGRGCESCGGVGFRGRAALFELLRVDERMRSLIHNRAPAAELRRCGRQCGMRLLREEGARFVQAGRTTPAEVLRVTHDYGTEGD